MSEFNFERSLEIKPARLGSATRQRVRHPQKIGFHFGGVEGLATRRHPQKTSVHFRGVEGLATRPVGVRETIRQIHCGACGGRSFEFVRLQASVVAAAQINSRKAARGSQSESGKAALRRVGRASGVVDAVGGIYGDCYQVYSVRTSKLSVKRSRQRHLIGQSMIHSPRVGHPPSCQ